MVASTFSARAVGDSAPRGPNRPSTRRAVVASRSRSGTGIDGLHAVLGTAVTWDRDNDQVELLTIDDLRQAAAEWSGLQTGEIDAALERLTLDPNQLPTGPASPSVAPAA